MIYILLNLDAVPYSTIVGWALFQGVSSFSVDALIIYVICSHCVIVILLVQTGFQKTNYRTCTIRLPWVMWSKEEIQAHWGDLEPQAVQNRKGTPTNGWNHQGKKKMCSIDKMWTQEKQWLTDILAQFLVILLLNFIHLVCVQCLLKCVLTLTNHSLHALVHGCSAEIKITVTCYPRNIFPLSPSSSTLG